MEDKLDNLQVYIVGTLKNAITGHFSIATSKECNEHYWRLSNSMVEAILG